MISSALKKMAFGVALIGAVGAANATDYNLGTLNTTVVRSDIHISSSFDDVFSFTIGSLPGVLGGIAGFDVYGDLTAQYRFGVGATPTWGGWSTLSSVPSDPDTGAFSYTATVGGFVSGQTYWFNLKGTAEQAAYSVTLAPVPELDSYAMLLAGLGLMGAIARRRKNNAAVFGA